MANTAIKLSDETLKALGATAADAESKILALISADAGNKTKLAESETQFSALTASITAIDERLKAVEGKSVIVPIVSAEDRKAIIEDAKKEARTSASAEVASILAKTGTRALPAGTASTETATGGDKPKANREAFQALSPKAQAEFCRAGGIVIES